MTLVVFDLDGTLLNKGSQVSCLYGRDARDDASREISLTPLQQGARCRPPPRR